MTPLEIVVVAVVGGLVLGRVAGAVRAMVGARMRNWHSAEAGYEPCADHFLPADVANLVMAVEALSFVVRGHCQLSGHSRATGQLSLLEHPRTLDVAKVVVSASGGRRTVMLLFQSHFEDGTELATANNQITVGLPGLPGTTHLWLPEVHDPVQLYEAHALARDSLARSRKRLAIGPDPMAYLNDARQRILNHFVQTGYYYLDRAHGVYRPTWKGAMLMTVRLVWPIRPLYRAWRQRPTRRLLREIGWFRSTS